MGQSEGKNVCFIQSKEKAMKEILRTNHLTERSSLHSKVVTAVREPYRGRAAGAE